MSWLPVTVTVAPASEPVTLAEAKTHCAVDGSDNDAELGLMIGAARTFVEEYCGIKLVSQTVVMRASSFCDLGHLPVAPLISTTSVTYLDTAGAEQTLSTDVYESVLVGLEPSIRLKINQSWPSPRTATDALRVTATAGYSSLPASIKHALLLLIGKWFDDRSVGEVPEGVKSLLSNHRKF